MNKMTMAMNTLNFSNRKRIEHTKTRIRPKESSSVYVDGTLICILKFANFQNQSAVSAD